MRHQNSRRHSRFASATVTAIVERLESRHLLSTVASLKLVASSGNLHQPSLKDGISSLGTFDVTSKSQLVSVLPSTGDQSAYRYTWRQISGPDGGRASFSRNSSSAARQNTISFSNVGTYEIQVSLEAAGVPIAQGNLTFNVISTATHLALRSSSGQVLTASSGLSLGGVSTQLEAVVLNQFGALLPSESAISWTASKSPAGSSPVINATGNSASFTFTRVGGYTITASAGPLRTSVPVTVAPTLTTFTLSTPDRTFLATGAKVTVTGSSLKLNLAAFDQFGQTLTTLPNVAWSTTAPAGQNATTSFSKGILTWTFSGPGRYSAQAVIAGQTFQFNADVTPSLSAVSIQKPDGTSISTKVPAATAGKKIEFAAMGLDQFGRALTENPAINWQIMTSPAGSNSRLTATGNSAVFEPDLAGRYTLRANSGAVYTDIPVTVTQTLTEMSLIRNDGSVTSVDAPLVVEKTLGTLRLIALDQFGRNMVTLPKITWAAAMTPANGTATVKLNGTNADVTFNRTGDYTLNAVSGNVSATAAFRVKSTLSSFAVSREGVVIAKPASGTSITGKSLTLTASPRDQFGQLPGTQVEPAWQIMSSPAGSSPRLTTTDNSVLFEPDLAGRYMLRASSGAVSTDIPVTVTQTLTEMSLVRTDGSATSTETPLVVEKTLGTLRLIAVDQFGRNMVTLPKITWAAAVTPVNGTAIVKLNGTIADVTFNRRGDYTLNAVSGNVSATAAFRVTPTLTSIAILRDRINISRNGAITPVQGDLVSLTAVARDQFEQNLENQPEQIWAVKSIVAGSDPVIERSSDKATIRFTTSGNYTLRVSSGAVSAIAGLSVIPTMTAIELSPSAFSLEGGASKLLSVRALDQFGTTLTKQPVFKWNAAGGTISPLGLYTAGRQAGNFTITVNAGTVSTSAAVVIDDPVTPTGLSDPDLNSLAIRFYADQSLDRSEVIQILRSTGADGIVTATELSDLQFPASAASPFLMPAYVRNLASDVVGTNPANLNFQRQALGNLAAGSSSVHLNKLVDKWFLGADEPQIATSGLTYQTAIGNLFNGVPSRADTRQGMLGDCYFIAAVASIADQNPTAVRDMFIDNGDGTFTVRFFASTASGVTTDFVTVNRRLPASSNGQLGYSGYGQSISQASTTLWIALAEKAYAQWNETRLSGRDGTNRYSAIEGGWMWFVNAQVLGTESTSAYFSSSEKSTLVNALSTGQAVTLGTWPYATAGGLYGSHAYIVTGYNTSADTFILHNPWGVSHPTPLSWAQLQSNCSVFVSTSTNSQSAPVRTGPAANSLSGLVAKPQSGESIRRSSDAHSLSMIVEDLRSLGETVRNPADRSLTVSNRRTEQHFASMKPTVSQTKPGCTSHPSELEVDLLDISFADIDALFSNEGP